MQVAIDVTIHVAVVLFLLPVMVPVLFEMATIMLNAPTSTSQKPIGHVGDHFRRYLL